MPAFERSQCLTSCRQVALRLPQAIGIGAGLGLKRAAAFELGPEVGGPPLHLGQHRFERSAQIDGILQGSGAKQGKGGRSAGQPLQGGGQLHQRLLTLGQTRAQLQPIALDQRRAGFIGGNSRFGLLNARGNAGGFTRRLFDRGIGRAGLGLKLCRTAAGGSSGSLSLGNCAAELVGIARRKRHLGHGAAQRGQRKQRGQSQDRSGRHRGPYPER